MDKIPQDAESLTVLVGGVKFLSEPIVTFVRLAQVIHEPLLMVITGACHVSPLSSRVICWVI